MRRIRKLYTSRVLPLVYDYSLSVTEMVGKLVRTVNDMADDVTDNTDDIETLQSDVSTLQDQTQMALNGVENLGNRLENVEEELENVPTDERIGELQSAINQNAADIVVLDSRVDILESQPDLSSEVHNNTANIATLRSDVSDLESDVSTLQTDVSGVQSDLSTLSGNVNTLSGNVSTLSGDVSSLQSDVGSLQSNVGTLQTDVGSLQTNVGTLQTDVGALQTAVASKSEVSYSVIITTGSQIGTITIDGVSTDLYAPSATVIPPASGITYDNTNSGLQATNVQDAVDEVNEKADNISVYVTNNEQTNGTLIGTVNITNQSGTTVNSNIRIPYNVSLKGRHDRTVYDQPQSPYQQYDLPRGVFAGHLTGSSKDIYFFVPTPYDYSGITFGNSLFLSASGAIRGISGYVDASSFTISDYKYNYDGQRTDTKRFTIDCQRGGILFMLHNENGFKTTASTPATYPNNTPVSVYLANFKLNDPY